MEKTKILFLFLFLIVIFNSFIPLGQFSIVKAQVAQEWVRRFSDTSSVSWGASSIKKDNLENIYVLAEKSNDFGFIKYDSSGNLLTVATYWPGGFDAGGGNYFDVSPYGDVYITGVVEINTILWIYTVKFNSNGVFQWGKPYNFDNVDEPEDVKIDKSGNIIIVGGSAVGNNNFALTVKYNSNGDTLWTRHFNLSPGYYAIYYKLIIDDTNNIYITGDVLDTGYKCLILKYNSHGNLLWYNTFTFDPTRSNSGSGISLDNFGNIYITGGQITSPYNYLHYYLLKLNNSGSVQWGSLFSSLGNTGNDVKGPVISADGNSIYYTTAEYGYGGVYFSITTLKYNSSGDTQWVRRFNGGDSSGGNLPGSIKLDKYDNIYVCGMGVFPVTGGDFVTIKYNPSGAQQWMERYSGIITNGEDNAYDLIIDSSLNVYVTGQSPNSANNGDVAVTIKYSQVDGIISNGKVIPKKIELYQNYPNPFNPSTKIKFSIPNIPLSRGVSEGRGVLVVLKIFDILGREVSTLVNEELKAGIYQIDWNAINYSSGIYFYKIQAGNFVETRKMVLVR